MRFPLPSSARGDLALKTRIFGSPQLLLGQEPLPRSGGNRYEFPLADGGTGEAQLLYQQDPFIPAVKIDGEVREVVPRSYLALTLSILPLVLGAALGASLGNRLGGIAFLVLGVFCGSIIGYFFQKAVYYVLRGPNHWFARAMVTFGLFFALLMLVVFASAILALLFPERMAQ